MHQTIGGPVPGVIREVFLPSFLPLHPPRDGVILKGLSHRAGILKGVFSLKMFLAHPDKQLLRKSFAEICFCNFKGNWDSNISGIFLCCQKHNFCKADDFGIIFGRTAL